jgi:cysteine-rich repeat protein
METRARTRRCPLPLFFLIPLLLGPLFSTSAHSGSLSDIEYVIHISVDGVNAGMLSSYMTTYPADFVNYQRLVDEGASTFNARTDYEYTVTQPCHTSQLTSMPVLEPAGQSQDTAHYYTDNGEPAASTTLHNNHPTPGIYISSAWDVAHDNSRSTSHHASKTKFIIYSQTYEANGGPDLIPPDDGTDKIDNFNITISRHFDSSIDDAYDMHQDFLTDMAANHYNYAFVHYVDPDKSGHLDGWGTALYRTTLEQADDYLGDVFNLVETDPVLMGKTAIIVVTDHGGGGSQLTGHFNNWDPEHYTIPFMVWGPGIEAGADLYALNAGVRSDPGTGRPDYNASPQPIRLTETGNLAMQLLGLPPIPNSWSNYAQDLVLSSVECGNGSLETGEDCDDGNTADGDCCSSICEYETVGSSCDDQNACTTLDTCDGAGTCDAGGPLDCDDSNVCTDDSCDTVLGCQYANNTNPCDDANACTVGDTCGGGVCTSGGPLDCNDSNVCTNDSCDTVLGCQYANNTNPCDDANACTVGDVCGGGVCTSGGPLDCNDSNVCTDDSCDTVLGCQYANNTGPCDDADACTVGDVCGGGVCTSGGPLACNDSNVCTDDSCDTFLGPRLRAACTPTIRTPAPTVTFATATRCAAAGVAAPDHRWTAMTATCARTTAVSRPRAATTSTTRTPAMLGTSAGWAAPAAAGPVRAAVRWIATTATRARTTAASRRRAATTSTTRPRAPTAISATATRCAAAEAVAPEHR